MFKKDLFLFSTLVLCLSLAMTLYAADVHLKWDPPDQAGALIGYRIYYGDIPGVHPIRVECGNKIEHTVKGLQENKDYYFVVRTYNNYAESADSNEVYWNSKMPAIAIMSPTEESYYDPPGISSSISLSGVASDDKGIYEVRWVNNRGGEGLASSTSDWTNWVIANINLVCGEDNIITVTVEDSDGYTASDSIRVNVEPCKTKGISIN